MSAFLSLLYALKNSAAPFLQGFGYSVPASSACSLFLVALGGIPLGTNPISTMHCWYPLGEGLVRVGGCQFPKSGFPVPKQRDAHPAF